MDRFEEKEIMWKRTLTKNTWYGWYDWLMNYILKPKKNCEYSRLMSKLWKGKETK